jgi:UDP-GlcNAc:undecaprenyl-phosphate/decaprenyl-phosphate GlcNAc-1-phosphate transferase
VRAYLYVMLVAAAVTYLVTPLARRFARRIGAITPVRSRDVHTVPIPRLGGTAVLVGFAAALLVASQMPFLSEVFDAGGSPWGVLLGAVAVCLLGVMDDLWTLDAVTKLAGQAIAALLMAWKGVQLVSLPVAGLTIPSSGTLLVLTVLVVVVTINAVNFVDGLDGLAAGIVGIAGSAFFVYSYLLSKDASPTDYSSLASLVTAALVGSCLGFLPHNFNPARIFMGDSGSMLIGLLLASATIAITGQVDPTAVSQAKIVPAFFPLALPLAVLALPLVDLLLAIVRRTRAGQAPWHPDKRHLHHRLLALGHSHAASVVIMYVWTGILAFGVASVAFVPLGTALVAAGIAVLLAILVTVGPDRLRQLHRSRRSNRSSVPGSRSRFPRSRFPHRPRPGAGDRSRSGDQAVDARRSP